MHSRTILGSKPLAVSVCICFLTLLLIYRGPTRDFVSHKLQGPRRSCSAALESQVRLLTSEYSKLLSGVTHVAMIGFPDHSNKGDSAIWIGEKMILDSLGIKPVHLCIDNNICDNEEMRKVLEAHGGPDKTAILFDGGGSFGDIWHNIQENRERVAVAFPDYRIRSFAQSYKFTKEENLMQAQEAYGQHPDLQLCARDSKSFLAMQRDFGKTHKVLLLPDVATMLSTSPLLSRPPKKSDIDFLFLARTDGEGGQDHGKEEPVIEELHSVTDQDGTLHNTNVIITDWIDKDPAGIKDFPLAEQARMRVEWTYDFLGQAALVLADRLHVHILTTVWGFDHITVEEGSYAKMRSYHDTWLLDCNDRVVMTSSVRQAVDTAKRWYKRGKSLS